MFRAPLPHDRCYRRGGGVFRLLGERYLTVFAPTGSCADPAISPILQLIASFEVSLPVAISPGC